MNSSKKMKTRKVITIHPRKLSSRNRSTLSSSFITPAGTKRRIINLLKNNKTLAVALQDARCELSFSRKMLEESSEYLNKIKFARLKMLEMQSVLKSFTDNFDETLLMLNFDDTNWNFGSSKRCTEKFQRLNPVIESVEEESEENFINKEVNIGQASIKDYGKSLNQIFSSISNIQSENCDEMVKVADIARSTNGVEVLNNCSQESIQNIGFIKTICMEVAPVSPLASNSKFEEATEFVKTTETSPVKHIEESGTPTFPLQTPTSIKSTSELKLNETEQLLREKNSSLTENHSKVITNPCTPKKVLSPPQNTIMEKAQTSKIPRFQDSGKAKESSLSKKFFKSKEISKRKFDQRKNEELDNGRRKTFVIKDKMLSDLKSSSISDNFSNENLPNVNESSNALCRRKTFVVQNADILEDQLVIENDRRKTFVKKPNNQSILLQHKRNTMTVAELASKTSEKSDENSENFNSNTHAPLCDKVIKDVQLKSTEINLSPVINKNTSDDIGKENPQDFDDMEISFEVNAKLEMHTSEEINRNLIFVSSNAGNTAEGNFDKLNAKLDLNIENNQCKADDGANVFMKLIDADISAGDILKVVENGEILHNNDEIHCGSSKLPFKFDSSESECDSILSENFDFSKQRSTIETTPIRKHIANNKKKVFVFDVKKRKSILKKGKTNESINPKTAMISSTKNNEISHLDTNEVPIETEQKINKTVNFVFDQEIDKGNAGSNLHFSSCNSKQIFKKAEKEKKSNGKSKKSHESCDAAVKNGFPSDKNPILVSTNENFAEAKQISAQKSSKSNAADVNFCEIVEIMNDTKGDKIKGHKIKSTKRSPPTDIVVDDIVSVAKKSKKNNSKKKEETAILKINENYIDDVTVYKSPKVKEKKSVNKSRKKDKTEPICKKTGKNTYLVKAEIHPPPPSPNRLKFENLNKENEMLKFQNFEVSVVLNDVLKSKNIDMLSLYEKDFLLTGQTSTKTSSDIPPNLNCKENVEYAINSSEVVSTRRRKEVKNYKEPSLNVKMRR